MAKRRRLLTRFTLVWLPIVFCIIAQVCGLVPMPWSVLLTVASVVWGISQECRNRGADQRRDDFERATAQLLVESGHGNPYLRAVETSFKPGEPRDPTPAIRMLELALEADPYSKDALAHLIVLRCLRLGEAQAVGGGALGPWDQEWADVNALAQRGARDYPSDPDFVQYLGVLADFAGKHTEAREHFERYGRMVPDGYWRLLTAKSWLMEGNHSQALGEVAAGLSEGLSPVLAAQQLGIALYRAGHFEQALDLIDQGLAVSKGSIELRLLRREVLLYSGRLVGASGCSVWLGLGYLRRGKVYPHAAMPLITGLGVFLIGSFLWTSRQFWRLTRAIPVLRTLHLWIAPPYQPYEWLGRELGLRGAIGAARRCLERSVAIYGRNPDATGLLALCLARQGDREGAIKRLEEALRLAPQHWQFTGWLDRLRAGERI